MAKPDPLITELIKTRYSCRDYLEKPLEESTQQALADFCAATTVGPLGASTRFGLITATPDDQSALRRLGTYGFIRGATGYIAGAVSPSTHDLEDYGYLLEKIILFATGSGLGTCWLGGTFTKSRFAEQIGLTDGDLMPAVSSVGYPFDGSKRRIWDLILPAEIRRTTQNSRVSWQTLFFDGDFDSPISQSLAGDYAIPLEMVRLAPSATNRQPWRIVRDGSRWHFFLQRTPGYREGRVMKWLNVDDLQRVDMGIAMCHFELTANELNLGGCWEISEPDIPKPNAWTEYTATWNIKP